MFTEPAVALDERVEFGSGEWVAEAGRHLPRASKAECFRCSRFPRGSTIHRRTF